MSFPTSTSASGIWTLKEALRYKAAGKWPRGPVAPTSLAGTGADTEVALTWTAPETTHGTITDYAVEYTPSSGSPTVVLTGSTAASYTVTGLTNDTEYTFRVAGVNHTQGEWSDSVAVTPGAASGWDISNAAFVQSFSVASQDTSPQGVFFKPDGLKMYIVGENGSDMNEYSLSAAWDISTASYSQNFSVFSQDKKPKGVFFKPDGLAMYIVGSSSPSNTRVVNEYSLSSAWDISTASHVQNFNSQPQDALPTGVFFKGDGTKMYVIGYENDGVYEYALSTAWDISTASYEQTFSVSTEDSSPNCVFFKADGLKMYVAGNAGDDVNEYDLSTAWDISTASYVQNFSVASQDTAPEGVFFKPDGTKMYVVGSSSDSVHEYSL